MSTRKPATTSSRLKLTGWIVAALLLTGCVAAVALPSERKELRGMTCAELTAEMLEMTGVSATEPYDLDRVRLINQVRDEKGCAI